MWTQKSLIIFIIHTLYIPMHTKSLLGFAREPHYTPHPVKITFFEFEGREETVPIWRLSCMSHSSKGILPHPWTVHVYLSSPRNQFPKKTQATGIAPHKCRHRVNSFPHLHPSHLQCPHTNMYMYLHLRTNILRKYKQQALL